MQFIVEVFVHLLPFLQTLEISGWIRVLHGQNVRTEEPQLALFATCCPFGPLSLMDIPSRELTFKSKHKMDFSPMSMDNRCVAKLVYTVIKYSLYLWNIHYQVIKVGSGKKGYGFMCKDSWGWYFYGMYSFFISYFSFSKMHICSLK